jgi:hypothetical protein
VSFAQRLITVTVQLAPNTGTNQPNTFQESGTDTVTLSGSRTSVRVQNSGAPADCNAQVKIWGMTPSLMNQLSTLGLVFNLVPKNQLTIQAGTMGPGGVPNLATIFTGTVWAAYGDYSAQPDVPFIFECLSYAADAVVSVPPSSFPGSANVSDIMSGFARQMNLGFENNGVSGTLSNAYFSGAVKIQAQKCADAAGISWGLFGNVLAIWPRGGNRSTPDMPVIAPPPEGDMISYPAFTQQGIVVKTLFDPTISFGSLIQVKSSLLSGIVSSQNANQGGAKSLAPSAALASSSLASAAATFPSVWAVNKLDLALDSLLPKGQWMSSVWAYNPNYSRAILPPA